NRHSYRLGFIQRGMVRQRNMLQRSMRPRQHRAVRRHAQQLGRGVPEAASQDSPPGPGLVSRDGVHGGPVQARLGCAACVAVAQSYPVMSRDCGGCVGSSPRPLIRGPISHFREELLEVPLVFPHGLSVFLPSLSCEKFTNAL
ncbi:UNVERIFIED_CONTAM: hypothetical protein K2H54_065646, partial [Gekko kuhli]